MSGHRLPATLVAALAGAALAAPASAVAEGAGDGPGPLPAGGLVQVAPEVTATRPVVPTVMPAAPRAPGARVTREAVMLTLPTVTAGARLLVVRARRTGRYRPIGTSRATVFADDEVRPGRVYRYRLVRIDGAGVRSAASAPVVVRVPRR